MYTFFAFIFEKKKRVNNDIVIIVIDGSCNHDYDYDKYIFDVIKLYKKKKKKKNI